MRAPDPAPARALGAALAQARRDGLEFPAAWRLSVHVAMQSCRRSTSRRQWLSVFEGTKPAWRASYLRLGQPADASLAGALQLLDSLDDDYEGPAGNVRLSAVW